MLKSRTLESRYEDICERTGLSLDIVKRVLQGRSESILEDLKKGREVVDYGVCKLVPKMTDDLGPGQVLRKKITVKAFPSPRIVDILNGLDRFEFDEQEDEEGIIVNTLSWQK